jgi:hypothetical protein
LNKSSNWVLERDASRTQGDWKPDRHGQIKLNDPVLGEIIAKCSPFRKSYDEGDLNALFIASAASSAAPTALACKEELEELVKLTATPLPDGKHYEGALALFQFAQRRIPAILARFPDASLAAFHKQQKTPTP